MKKKKEKWIRFTALLFAIALAIPSISYAKEESRILSKIHHIHTGNQEEGGGCYGKEIRHIHQGSEEGGGDCFSAPVYHVHQGMKAEGNVFKKRSGIRIKERKKPEQDAMGSRFIMSMRRCEGKGDVTASRFTISIREARPEKGLL